MVYFAKKVSEKMIWEKQSRAESADAYREEKHMKTGKQESFLAIPAMKWHVMKVSHRSANGEERCREHAHPFSWVFRHSAAILSPFPQVSASLWPRRCHEHSDWKQGGHNYYYRMVWNWQLSGNLQSSGTRFHPSVPGALSWMPTMTLRGPIQILDGLPEDSNPGTYQHGKTKQNNK